MIIGMTGTRHGMTEAQKESFRELLIWFKEHTPPWDKPELHHGDCVGADEEAHKIAKDLDYRVIVHPPINESARAFCLGDKILEQKEYIDRNHDIVDVSDYLIGAPSSSREQVRSGTWATMRYSAKNYPDNLIIIQPDGETRSDI
jgi:hypothetical protein